jgi:dTDP-4-dehydrorhamnose 3,5-epimerase
MQEPPTTETPFDDVLLFGLEAHRDARGALTEAYRRTWVPGGREIRQANVSWSAAGVLRGLHWHRRQADYWCILSGIALVSLVDLRPGSPTRGTAFQRRIDARTELLGIAIPPRIAHGFCAEADVTLLYLVDEHFTGEDEFGLAWDDPDLALEWPIAEPRLSERDRSNRTLAEALAEASRT